MILYFIVRRYLLLYNIMLTNLNLFISYHKLSKYELCTLKSYFNTILPIGNKNSKCKIIYRYQVILLYHEPRVVSETIAVFLKKYIFFTILFIAILSFFNDSMRF